MSDTYLIQRINDAIASIEREAKCCDNEIPEWNGRKGGDHWREHAQLLREAAAALARERQRAAFYRDHLRAVYYDRWREAGDSDPSGAADRSIAAVEETEIPR